MPSEKVLELKKQKVADLTEQLKNACAGVVVDYKGINVADDTKLRKELREAGVHYAVVKNTLLHLAPARILCKFADANKNFTVKSGFLDNDVISLEKISSLAKLPSREVLLATVCNAFNAPIASFARAIQAIVDKSGEAVPAQAEAPAEA